MPALQSRPFVGLYLAALLYDSTSASCAALAEALRIASHGRLTSLLQPYWSGPRRLEKAVRRRFVRKRGDFILDETGIPRLFATAMEGWAGVCSSQERTPMYGFSLVLLARTRGLEGASSRAINVLTLPQEQKLDNGEGTGAAEQEKQCAHHWFLGKWTEVPVTYSPESVGTVLQEVGLERGSEI
jgi:hypothetical protein